MSIDRDLLMLMQAGHITLADARAVIDAPPSDPLVADLVAWLRGGGDSPALDDVARTAGRVARLPAVLAAARKVAAARVAIGGHADWPLARCPGHANEPGVRDVGRHDECEACRANDAADERYASAEHDLLAASHDLVVALAAADGAP